MTTPTGPTLSDLQREATDLEHLLRRYIDDRSFMSSDLNNHILYFLDAHEIKSFINPRRLEEPDGFILNAESVRFRTAHARFMLDMKLKNDQLMGDLLFDSGIGQAGLLPSHGEEIEEELAFQNMIVARHQIRLLEDAQKQIKNLRSSQSLRRILAATASGRMNAELKAGILNFFRNAAPALLALIRRNPDDSKERIEKLIEDSALVPLSDIEWGDFGFSEELSRKLRAFEPDPKLVQSWRQYLADQRRQNSNRANRIDGTALACLQGLNALLAALPGPNVRACLVTRAWTLIGLSRDRKVARVVGLREANFLRHPRLAVLNSSIPFLRTRSAGNGIIDDRPEKALVVALETYRHQLADQAHAETDSDQTLAAINALVQAWEDFEKARFAIGLRLEPGAPGDPHDRISDKDLRRLLDWFRSDSDIVKLVKDELLRSVQRFEEATFNLRRGSGGRIDAHVLLLENPPRWRITPLVRNLIGPIDFPATGGITLAGGAVCLEDQLHQITSVTSEYHAKNYLARSLLLVCEEQYGLAENYAASALDIARLEGPEAEGAKTEARFLQAQIRRLGMRDDQDAIERYRENLAVLDEIGDSEDPRMPWERATQLLELGLTLGAGEGTASSLSGGWVELQGARALCSGDQRFRTSILALGVAYDLAQRSRPDLWPQPDSAFRRAAPEWHDELHALMGRLAGEGGRRELPLAVRAMELIGFQLIDPPSPKTGQLAILGRSPLLLGEGQPLRIPAELRLEAPDVLKGLEAEVVHPDDVLKISDRKDCTSALIIEALKRIVARLQHNLQRDLIFAPMWISYASDRILELIADGEAKGRAQKAYEIMGRVAGASQQLGVFERDREDLLKASKLLQDATLLVTERAAEGNASARRASYFLRMGGCYAELLLTLLIHGPQRQIRFEALVESYRAIAGDFDRAAIPHFRMNVIFEELGRRAEARLALGEAWNRIDSDPFELDPHHWVRSTIRRRRAVQLLEDLPMTVMRAEILSGTADSQMREKYLRTLREAFLTEWENYTPPSEDSDFLFQLEDRRRVNNIVYHASLILEVSPEEDELMRLGLSREELSKLLGQLHRSGIDAVPEAGITHTIGFAYHILKEPELARQAGLHLRKLVIEQDMEDVHRARMLLHDSAPWTPGGSRIEPAHESRTGDSVRPVRAAAFRSAEFPRTQGR